MCDRAFDDEELVADRFRIRRFIARGGMGEVYEADDLELQERVALKVVGGSCRDELSLQRFKREIQLARKVTHPSVCRIFDVYRHTQAKRGRVTEITFVTMELLRGETLSQFMQRTGRMTEQQALPLIKQMAWALTAAHRAGVIHRDFKASNVTLVPKAGIRQGDRVRVVVTDFGLAQSIGKDKSANPAPDKTTVSGTVEYMAPEQASGQDVTPACDIYSFGVVMFEMLTGTRPHTGGSAMAVLARRLSDPAPSPQALVPELDSIWDATINRCLAVEPNQRFSSAAEVLAEIRGTAVELADLSDDITDEMPALRQADTTTQQLPVVRIRDRRRIWRFFAMTGGLLALAAALFLFFFLVEVISRETRSRETPSLVQLTDWSGLELDPCFSPDGKAIAYCSDRSGSFDIYVRQLAGGEETRLTTDGQNFQPTISPDGQQIAFYSRDRAGIWLLATTGGEPHRLTNFGSHPQWSPDGTRIVFQSDGRARLSADSPAALPPSTIWVVGVTDGSLAAVTIPAKPPGGHGGPTWSPDGKRIAFSVSDRRVSGIWMTEPDGGGLAQVVDSPSYALHPVFAPDGKTLYFLAPTQGNRFEIWRLPISRRSGSASGEPEAELGLSLANLRHFAFSADGKRMTFTAFSAQSNLWSLPISPVSTLAEGEPRQLTKGTGRNTRPAFSPDASMLAFDRWRLGSDPDIWIMAADGQKLSQLTDTRSAETQVSWFPAGSRLAFLSNHEGQWSLWSSDLQTPAKPFFGLDTDLHWASLSPDGNRVAYHSDVNSETLNVWVINIDGSEPKQITHDSELAAYPCWSPDGNYLAFAVRRGEDTHVMVASSHNGTAEPVQLTFAAGESWPFSWSPDSRKIVFAGFRDGLWNIWWISPTTRETEQLTYYTGLDTAVRCPAWSPLDNQIVYELVKTWGDIWYAELG